MALRLLLHFALTILLIWALSLYLSAYIAVTGGWTAYITIGALITLMNLLVRPVLVLLTLPLKLFATILAIIIVNGLFLWLTMKITTLMDPGLVTMEIRGGILGWAIIAVILGIANAVLKSTLKRRD